MKAFARVLANGLLWVAAIGATIWAVGALAHDLPWTTARRPVALAFATAAVLLWVVVPGRWLKPVVLLAVVTAVITWWITLKPSHDRDWQPDVAHLPHADINGDMVTLHNVRNFDYRTATDFTPRWETRTVDLSQLTGADMAINYWGSPWMAHPIVSFQFANAPPVCISIETRKEAGESYSAVGGLYRQFELVYVVADERDVLRLRTNFRPGEDTFLYRLALTPEQARRRFLQYLEAINQLPNSPQWYHAVTTNCTTTIRAHTPPDQRLPWDWRLLVNGKGDAMMFERGHFVTDGLAFPELKKHAHINGAARSASDSPGFSRLIRHNRPGFAAP